MQPNIYSKEVHLIPIEKIDPKVFYIIQKLRQYGHVAYLVGGSVRDLLLQRIPKDFDISTSAKPEEIKGLFPSAILIGKRFRLAHIRFGKKAFEVSTFRASVTDEEKIILRDNIWGNEEEDVLRRDFTINGLYFDPETQTLIDYVGGFEDIKKGILRTIGQPALKFIQDPVRMLRLIKFRARFSFEIEPATFKALEDHRHEITKSSQARILEELLRMLESGAAKNFFSLMYIHGLLEDLLPSIHRFFSAKKEGYLLALLDILDSLAKNTQKPPRALALASLIFPIFDVYMKGEFLDCHSTFHLGMIQEEARELLHSIFSPFFLLSKRLKSEAISIMTHQYRFIPLLAFKRKESYRIPRDPNFSLALHFLKIRSLVDPNLFSIYERWQKALSSVKMRRQESVNYHEN